MWSGSFRVQNWDVRTPALWGSSGPLSPDTSALISAHSHPCNRGNIRSNNLLSTFYKIGIVLDILPVLSLLIHLIILYSKQ